GLKLELEKGIDHGFFQEFAVGLRWSERSARFRATTRDDIAPLGTVNGDRAAPSVPNASTIPGFGSVNPEGPLDYYGTPHWYGASPDFLYNNPDQVRALFGLAPGPANFNPTRGFADDESVLAGFFDTRFAT